MTVKSHSDKNKLFLKLVTKQFGRFPLNEATIQLARNLSALVNGVLQQEAFQQQESPAGALSYDEGSQQLPGWQAGGITPLSAGIVGEHCKLAAVPGTVESALQHVPVGYMYELTASLVPLSIVLISGVFIGQVH